LDIRGNVDTRIRKALDKEGDYDAIILAFAGISRLGRESVISEIIDINLMLPAPAQGAIAVQSRQSQDLIQLLAAIHHTPTALAVTAERAFLAGLGGGCSVPIAAYAYEKDGVTVLRGRIISLDGKQELDLDQSLAQEALEKGAKALLESQ
jgi:hydroxymethylbilane synthase